MEIRNLLVIFDQLLKREDIFEVISGLSLGPAEYDLHHRNRGYGPVMTVIQENSFSASLCIFALTSYGVITWIVVLAATQKMKELMCYPRNCSRTEKKRFQRASSSSRKMMKSMLFCILVYSNLQAASAMERAMQQLVELQGRNMETVQAFMQQVTESSSASSQQSSALSQAITDFGRIVHETQARTLSGIESALESYSSRAGASELHKLVKAPEVFFSGTWDEERKTFPDFRRKFKTWLSAIEPRFEDHLDVIERDTGTPLKEGDMTPRTKALGKKLYAVLTSYTKGRPLRTISKVPGQNGFKAYRLLVHENMPKSQVRNFHLLQNINNFKAKPGKSLAHTQQSCQHWQRSSEHT